MALDPGVQSGRTEKVISQLSTKTVGPPLTTTGLTGDKIPDTILQVSDFDKAKNQINIELANLEVLERLNQIGQISNRLSQSGPIPETSFNTQVSITASGEGNGANVFTPTVGEVWSIQAISYDENISGNAVVYVGLKDDSDLITYFSIDTTGGSPWSPDNEFNKMVYIDSKMTLFVYVYGTFSGADRVLCNFNLIRVR